MCFHRREHHQPSWEMKSTLCNQEALPTRARAKPLRVYIVTLNNLDLYRHQHSGRILRIIWGHILPAHPTNVQCQRFYTIFCSLSHFIKKMKIFTQKERKQFGFPLALDSSHSWSSALNVGRYTTGCPLNRLDSSREYKIKNFQSHKMCFHFSLSDFFLFFSPTRLGAKWKIFLYVVFFYYRWKNRFSSFHLKFKSLDCAVTRSWSWANYLSFRH